MNKARLMAGLMLQLTPLLSTANTCAAFVNHAYEAVDMNSRPGLPPRTTTPGGRALKFYASVRLEYQPIGESKTKAFDPLSGDAIQEAVASRVFVKCTKNKLAKPSKRVEVRITYGAGFDNTWSALQVLLTQKRVIKSGAWYYFDRAASLVHPDMPVTGATKRPSLNGESNVLRFAAEHPEWRDALIRLAIAGIDVNGDAAFADEPDDESGDDE